MALEVGADCCLFLRLMACPLYLVHLVAVAYSFFKILIVKNYGTFYLSKRRFIVYFDFPITPFYFQRLVVLAHLVLCCPPRSLP